MLGSANQRSQDSVTDLALEVNRLLNKHAIDTHKRCAQDVHDIKQVREQSVREEGRNRISERVSEVTTFEFEQGT